MSMDDIPGRDRSTTWRAPSRLQDVDLIVDLGRERALVVRGIATLWPLGESALLDLLVGSWRVDESRRRPDRAPSDSLCVLQRCEGGAWFDTGLTGDFMVTAGALVVRDVDVLPAAAPSVAGGGRLRVVKVPMLQCQSLLDHEAALVASSLSGDPGPTALLSRYCAALFDQVSHLDRP